MSFMVEYNSARSANAFSDCAEYEVLPGGALLVWDGDYSEVIAADRWKDVVSEDSHLPVNAKLVKLAV